MIKYKYIIYLLLISILYIIYNLIYNIEGFKTKYKLFVINLDNNRDRYEKIKSRCNNQNININRYSAINGKMLNKNGIYNNVHYNKKLSPGQIGCGLSHIMLLEYIQHNIKNVEYIIILEDDVIIPKNVIEQLDNILEKAPKNWDILYLGGSNIIGYKVKKMFIKPKTGVKGNWGTHAYMIKYNFIKHWLKLINPLQKPIDVQGRDQFGLINAYFVYPTLINPQWNYESTITNKKYSNNSIKLYKSYRILGEEE